MRDQPLPLITGKHDVATARHIVDLGYPKVAPILPFILEWIQDCNWPVAHVLCPFLTSIGKPIFPEIRRVFATDDDIWKYWCIGVLQSMDLSLVEEMRPDLITIATQPTPGEEREGAAERARELLQEMNQEKAEQDAAANP